MTNQQFRTYLDTQDFSGLFNEAGWDNPSSSRPLHVEIGPEGERRAYTFREVAYLFARVYVCEVDKLPGTSERHALDVCLKRNGEQYIAIYVLRDDPACQCWVVPVEAVDRRHLVSILNNHGSQTNFLHEKIQRITFTIDQEPTSISVLERIRQAFAVNAAEVTKQFYKVFRKYHADFVKQLVGIMDNADAEWYASVMLNRLMFCYFLQKKGFLDEDVDYLRHHLEEVRTRHGNDTFYGSFYKRFLCVLFRKGLNAREHAADFEESFGRIPYLNGGMFDFHELERKYPDLDLPDVLFENLFDFFDQWHWHLDTSVTASGRDINPDVLGYIFEQYINDRAEMGAYYTKEDITEYISRNTIVPWLLEEVAKKSPAAFRKDGFVWKTLRESGDAFIFPAVRKGMEFDLPPEIARGVDTQAPDLLARRAGWNAPADVAYALPTEIWRETVARRQRCQETRDTIASGAIQSVNDLITFNLNIRAFAQTLLERTDDPLFIRHFFDALTHVTILDPTCGSGAFLFAALNILEPLYEACLAKMEQWPDRFKEALALLKTNFRGNTRHYIYKIIILNNLYGVDIMHEATEIAKLRLFLKIVAAVDVAPNDENLGLDPLPDIDFNIRCGNTLVGYANPQAVKDGLYNENCLALYQEAYRAIERKAADVADLYNRFRAIQAQDAADADYHDAKRALQTHLNTLNAALDSVLAQVHHNLGPGVSDYDNRFAQWKANTRPFHWFSEFYAITVAHGGFDVIIGNPPYVEARKVVDYDIPESYATFSCGNLYAYILERSLSLLRTKSKYGFIIPISSISNQKFTSLQSILFKSTVSFFSSYSNRPGKLFEGVEQRLTICLGEVRANPKFEYYSSEYQHWYKEERDNLFSRLTYCKHSNSSSHSYIHKAGVAITSRILLKLMTQPTKEFVKILDKHGESVFFHNAPTYFIRAMSFIPNTGNGLQASSHYKSIFVQKEQYHFVTALLNSSLFYWFYKVISNCRDFSEREIYCFPLPFVEGSVFDKTELELKASYVKNKAIKSRVYSGQRVYYEEYYPALSKSIIDEIDTLLAKAYGFAAEELDFIINYDIKYRMGDELNGAE